MRSTPLTILASLLFAVSTRAATSHWSQAGESDFKSGKFHDTVVTNLGDLKLSRSVRKLLEQDPKVAAVYALAEAADGTVYAGTGPQGVLLSVKDDKVTTAAVLGDGVNINSIVVEPDGGLLLGTAGAKGQVLRIAHPGDKPKSVFEEAGVQYVWAIARTADGMIYAATGPNGQLFEIDPAGGHRVLLKTDDNNFTCMASRGDDLFVGSDPNGLVYKVDRKSGRSFVLLDAAEAEIGAIAVDDKGNVFVGTSQAFEPPKDAKSDTPKDKIGRPEGGPGGVPIQSDPPPATPPAPDPNPGHGEPLPKSRRVGGVEEMTRAEPQRRGEQLVVEQRTNKSHVDDLREFPLKRLRLREDASGQSNLQTAVESLSSSAPLRLCASYLFDDDDKPTADDPKSDDKKKSDEPKPQQAANPATAGQPIPQGNAIYKIDADGLTTEIFRGPVLVLGIVEHDGALLVATGSDGGVYQINPSAGETAMIAKLDVKQVTALLPTRDGRVILGLSNVGGLSVMGSGLSTEGTYISEVFDAAQGAKFGHVQLHGAVPNGTKLTVATRSGNLKEPTDARWSPWSTDVPAAQFVKIDSPAARFFQYRLTFSTTDATQSAVIRDVDVSYLTPNQAPVVKAVRVVLGGKSADADSNGPAGRFQTIVWEATDPNDDPLKYSLFYRRTSGTQWIPLKAKLKDPLFEWDTRTVPDGRYEIKVVASDEAANPVGQGKTGSRISEPVLVDNTPPTITELKSDVVRQSFKATIKASDATSTVTAVDYSVDGSGDWQAATPSDTMFDRPEAAASLSIADLSPGPHQIAVRVTDARGNQAFSSVNVVVEPTKP